MKVLADPDVLSMSEQDLRDLAIPTPEYENVLSAWPTPKTDWSDLQSTAEKYRFLDEVAADSDVPDSLVAETFHSFSTRDGHTLPMRTFSAAAGKKSGPGGPLIVLYHGGGLVLGSPVMVASLARWLVTQFNAVVVAPAYRLAPEHPWPAPVNDAWDALVYIRSHASTVFAADTSRGFVIGGISAGGTIAVSFAHKARDKWTPSSGPMVTGVFSSWGSTRTVDEQGKELEEGYRERYLSRREEGCVDNPVLSRDFLGWLNACLKADVNDPVYSSLLWPPDGERKGLFGHQGLPRVYLQTSGRDPSRDENLIFGDMLTREGVERRLDLYAGVPHCFFLHLSHLPEYERWKKDTIDGFRWLLSGKGR
ncbi:unnamed protein product [Zymoseptoria tritici ST99CH_3D1]|uniref:Alpha/beta hydrolase fold-3 domain-containing protein n=1 Tax=Zymoseptoria tritici ST99CH_1E4 TaxID=1276532 RepID=A0A2H1G4M2_ZYMTR|nr:unnamed protein product [Zymoseptoria tritici ST99CH_1E4]SMR49687.1 unnamed protein product [Zymoseptoria tritici ST99CH_3D1]